MSHTLPSRYYTDPTVFQEELERFYFKMWVCVGRSSQIPEAGSYFVRQLGDDSLFVVRDPQGGIRAFFNVCRHRGTRLCTEPEGHFSGVIQCPYHAWTYDLEGRLIGAPHMDDVAGFRKEDYPLQSIELDEWDGHLFARLTPGGDSLRDQLLDLPTKFAPWRMGELQTAHRTTYNVMANWKLIIQNYSECLHCPIIHPGLHKLSHYLSGCNDPFQPTYMGGSMTFRDGIETLSADGKRHRAVLAGLNDEQRRHVYYYAIFPNLLLSLHPDYMLTHTLWPEACDRTTILCEWHFHPHEVARDRFEPDDVVEFWDATNREDWRVSELCQLGMKSRAYRPGPYSPREGLLADFDEFIIGYGGSGGHKQERS